VIKGSKPGKKSVELRPVARPSRIRRDPLPGAEADRLARAAWWTSSEWEIRLALAGIAFFALAIAAVVIDLGVLMSR
jgi:hypothetical protein